MRFIRFSGSYYAEGNIVVNNNFKDFQEFIDKRDLRATRDNPAFRKFVRADVEQLSSYTMATFWEDLSKYLDETKSAEANYQKIRQGNVSDELKALFPKIDRARNEFNYPEVNRLLKAFEEEHSGLLQDVAKVYYLRGQNYELQINYPEAERYYGKAAVNEEQNSFYLDTYAGILTTLGKYAEAEPLYRRALAIDEKALGKEHPTSITVRNNLDALLKKKQETKLNKAGKLHANSV